VGSRIWGGNDLDSLFTPDIVTPDQFFANRRDDSAVRPLKLLMMAVLEDAIVTFQKNAINQSRNGRTLFSEVEQWLCDRSHEGLFSFESVCDTLSISAECLRNELLRWRERLLQSGAESRLARRRRPVLREARMSLIRRRKKVGHKQFAAKGSTEAEAAPRPRHIAAISADHQGGK